MKKGRFLTIPIACIAVFLLFLHISISSSVTHTTQFQGLRDWALTIKSAIVNYQSEPTEPIVTCDQSHEIYDLCSINGPTLLDPSTSTFFSINPIKPSPSSEPVKIKPYTRKKDERAMSKVRELTLQPSPPPNTFCGVTHNSSALVFSTGGYTGNFFHEFNDGFIPLFITVNSLPLDQDIIYVIANSKDWWMQKYNMLLRYLTRKPIIMMENENTTHCFPSVIVGLISHGPMNVDPMLLPNNPKTLLDFQAFLDNAYNKNGSSSSSNSNGNRNTSVNCKPRLVLLKRKGINVGRTFLNLEEIKQATEEAGFHVIIFEPTRNTSLIDAYSLIHSCHAMVGIHGAAFTHFLFLRPGSVLLQVVPIGTNWMSKTYFEDPARKLRMEYIEYKIKAEESSLIEKFRVDDLVFNNPHGFTRGNWSNMGLYLKQNVKVDMVRFKKYLKMAHDKAKEFMDKEN